MDAVPLFNAEKKTDPKILNPLAGRDRAYSRKPSGVRAFSLRQIIFLRKKGPEPVQILANGSIGSYRTVHWAPVYELLSKRQSEISLLHVSGALVLVNGYFAGSCHSGRTRPKTGKDKGADTKKAVRPKGRTVKRRRAIF